MEAVKLGQIVHYRLSKADAEKVNAARTAHVGNSAYAGEVVPLLITKIDPEVPAEFEGDPAAREATINGQAFLDGNFHHLWIERVKEPKEPKEGETKEANEYGTWTADLNKAEADKAAKADEVKAEAGRKAEEANAARERQSEYPPQPQPAVTTNPPAEYAAPAEEAKYVPAKPSKSLRQMNREDPTNL